MKLDCIELRAFLSELLLGITRDREIHIISAEQQMLAHCHAFQLQLTRLLGNRYQTEVCCSAANIDNQDEVSGFYLLAPICISLDPCIEGGLRFFDDDRFGVTGQL